MGFRSTDQCHGRWIAEFVKWITGCLEELPGFDRGHYCVCDDCRVGFEHLHWTFILVFLRRTGRPNIDFFVFAPADDIFGVITESSSDLATCVLVALEFQFQSLISVVVDSHSRIIRSDE